MKNIIYKMQLMIDTLQTEELDVSGALLVMAETKERLERIRKDESGANNEVQAVCSFAKQFDVDAEYEFRKIHCKCVPPRRLDESFRDCSRSYNGQLLSKGSVYICRHNVVGTIL